MNVLKNIAGAALIMAFMVSCEDEDFKNVAESTDGPGLTEISFSSFSAIVGPDANGLEDGTFITVEPLAIGVSSYTIDFGAGGEEVTIGQGESASYDYSNTLQQATYTISVTANSDEGLESVVKTADVTIEHMPTAVSAAPSSPTIGLEEVLSVYSGGIEYNDATIGYRYVVGGINAGNGDAQLSEVTTASGNKVLQYSRMSSSVGASITHDEIVVSDAFEAGVAATHLHLDVHSSFAVGIDKLKISLVNGGTEYVYNQDLVDGEWITLDLDLASDFSAPVVQFSEVKLELGAGGTANDAATLHVDNVYFSKPVTSVILNGDFTAKTDHWKFTTFTDGITTPFGSSSDGSWSNYDGSDNGSKTAGAKWTSSQSAGALKSAFSRYAYQALQLEPDTDYILEYEYTIKSDSADDPIGGRRLVGTVLNGHYTDGADAVSEISSNLGSHVGYIAGGKFSSTVGTTVQIPFTSNETGEVAVMFYAVTPKDAWIDNVKVTLAP